MVTGDIKAQRHKRLALVVEQASADDKALVLFHSIAQNTVQIEPCQTALVQHSVGSDRNGVYLPCAVGMDGVGIAVTQKLFPRMVTGLELFKAVNGNKIRKDLRRLHRSSARSHVCSGGFSRNSLSAGRKNGNHKDSTKQYRKQTFHKFSSFVVYDKDVPPLPRKFSWAEGTKQAYLSPGSPAQVYFVNLVSPVPVQVVLAV